MIYQIKILIKIFENCSSKIAKYILFCKYMYINLQNLKEMLSISTKYTDNELMMVKNAIHINTYLCKILKIVLTENDIYSSI